MIEWINCCLENKITSFDHADIYGDYTTEKAFVNAFSESKIDRNKIQLIYKCGIQMPSENKKKTLLNIMITPYPMSSIP
jgi:predicted oxidoreductase